VSPPLTVYLGSTNHYLTPKYPKGTSIGPATFATCPISFSLIKAFGHDTRRVGLRIDMSPYGGRRNRARCTFGQLSILRGLGSFDNTVGLTTQTDHQLWRRYTFCRVTLYAHIRFLSLPVPSCQRFPSIHRPSFIDIHFCAWSLSVNGSNLSLDPHSSTSIVCAFASPLSLVTFPTTNLNLVFTQ
jgi:hypothetical protein